MLCALADTRVRAQAPRAGAAAAAGGLALSPAGPAPAAGGAPRNDELLAATANRLGRELAECRRARLALQRDADHALEKSVSLEAALDAERSRAAHRQRAAEAELRRAKAECARLQAEADGLRADFADADQMCAALRDRLDDEGARAGDLERELGVALARLDRYSGDRVDDLGFIDWLLREVARLMAELESAYAAAPSRAVSPAPADGLGASRKRRASADGESVASSTNTRPASRGRRSPARSAAASPADPVSPQAGSASPAYGPASPSYCPVSPPWYARCPSGASPPSPSYDPRSPPWNGAAADRARRSGAGGA